MKNKEKIWSQRERRKERFLSIQKPIQKKYTLYMLLEGGGLVLARTIKKVMSSLVLDSHVNN